MQVETISIDELVSPEWNPRVISELEMEKLKNSIKEFGYVDPIIVNRHNNHIVGGNQRCQALKVLGYEEVDVIFINEPDINKEKALNISLNNISGEWDTIKLDKILHDLELEDFDLKLTSFDDLQINDLELDIDTSNFYENVQTSAEEPVDIEEDDYKILEEEDIQVNVKTGDLFALGNHFLLCGDSTNEANVKKLMNGTKAKILFTSPPYSDMRDYHTTSENLEVTNLIKFIKSFQPYTDYQVINLA